MSVIYLIRHGQASFGQQNYDQLSEVGHQQAVALPLPEVGQRRGHRALCNGVLTLLCTSMVKHARAPHMTAAKPAAT